MRLWQRPIVRVLVVQAAAMLWLGPLQRWLLNADLPGCEPLTVNVVTAVGVALVLLRAGRVWQVTGPSPRGHLWQALRWIALATAYFALRTSRWREPSFLVLRDCVEVTLVATFEELIWRGWILGTLRVRYGVPIAVAASSVLFGLAHTALLAHGTGIALVAVKVAWTVSVRPSPVHRPRLTSWRWWRAGATAARGRAPGRARPSRRAA